MIPVDLAIGSYTAATGGRGRGITLAHWDGSRLSVRDELVADSPSFVAWSADGRTIYAAEESAIGAILAVEVCNDKLRHSCRTEVESARPCHVRVHPSGDFLAVSCYGGGTFVTARIRADGGIEPASSSVQQHGRGPHPTRQDRPHPHSVLFTPDGSRSVLIDIGTDTVSLHAVTNSEIATEALSTANSAPGAGPRHAAWLDENTLAVVEEISATVTLFRVEASRIARLNDGVPTSSSAGADAWPSEIVATADGVAIANRSPGSIAQFAREGESLTLRAELALPKGANPRHLAVLPDGCFVVSLQDADEIVVMDNDGRVASALSTGSPSCVAIASMGQ